MTEFNENIVSTMQTNTKLKAVFINEAGEWLFHETKGFEEFSREEVLGGEIATKGKGKGKGKSKDAE